MIGFRFINLLVPGDPARFSINGATGSWAFEQEPHFETVKDAVANRIQCAETYTGQHPASMDAGVAGCERAFEELLPLCLGASYATGRSVTCRRSLPLSDVTVLEIGPHFPRERSINGSQAIITNDTEFKAIVEAFLVAYDRVGRTEKVRLVVHHWLDTLACWAFEDLYLSGTTVLQIIAATEENILPIRSKPSFYKYLLAAAHRYGLPALSHDVIKMRNDLVHDGTLSGTTFINKNAPDCGTAAAEALNWIDCYLHAVLNLGPVRRIRFDALSFDNLNAYSL